MAAERSYRALGTLTPGFPVPGGVGSARPGPYAGSKSFLFIIIPIPSLVGHYNRSAATLPLRIADNGMVLLGPCTPLT